MSGGPSTEQGKAIVARNAVRHGVLSPNPVVGVMETEEAWEAHHAEVVGALAPQGGMEQALAQRVALNLWRLGRVVRYETGCVTRRQESVEEQWALNGKRRLDGTVDLRSVAEQLARWERLAELFQRLPELPAGQVLDGMDVEAFFEVLAALLRIRELDDLRIPGLTPGYLPRSRSEWEAGVVRAGWAEIARRHGKDPEVLGRLALQEFAARRARAEQQAEQVRREIDGLRRERLLPAADDLEKVTRYEAHLSRELYRALHELEAIQARRRGHLPTVLRVDVNGTAPGPA